MCRSLWIVGLNYTVGTCQSILPDTCKAVRLAIQNVGNIVCKVSSHINWHGITKSFDFLVLYNVQSIYQYKKNNVLNMSYLLRKLSVPATLKAKQSFQWYHFSRKNIGQDYKGKVKLLGEICPKTSQATHCDSCPEVIEVYSGRYKLHSNTYISS